MKKKIAFITGAGGQDGSYLAEHLLAYGYEVHGLERSKSKSECVFLPNEVILHKGDICDFEFIKHILFTIKPSRIFNLAAQSNVKLSCDLPHITTNVNAIGSLNMLESFRICCPEARFYQASSSEMFGLCVDDDGFQRETTCMIPITPYGISKLYAYQMCEYYRKQFDLFISNGILFNHESPRRPLSFLTTKVIKTAVDIKLGKVSELRIGNTSVSRDWGHSKDYTRSMILILDHSKADNFIISSMKTHTVEYLIKYVFSKLELDYTKHVIQDEFFIRNIDQKNVCGDSSKARKILQWELEYSFESMIDEMIKFWKIKCKF